MHAMFLLVLCVFMLLRFDVSRGLMFAYEYNHSHLFVLWVGLCVAYGLCPGLQDAIDFYFLTRIIILLHIFIFYLGASFLCMVYFIQLADFYSLILKCCFV